MNRSVARLPIIAAVAVAGAVAAGCGVKHAYVAPTPSVPAAWDGSAPRPGEGGEEALAAWWNAFGDPQLTSFVTRAIAGNLDVRTALSRVVPTE